MIAWKKKVEGLVQLGIEMAKDWRVIGFVLGKATLDTLASFKDWSKELGMSSGQALQLGAKILSSISIKTDYLICGEKTGSKIIKAKEMKIKILSEKEWILMIS